MDLGPTTGLIWAVLSRGDDTVTVNGAAYSKKACYLQALKLDPQDPQGNVLAQRDAWNATWATLDPQLAWTNLGMALEAMAAV